MSLGKLTIIVATTIAAGGVVASLVIRHGAQMKLREKETVMRQQGNQLDKLAAEHQRLSNLLVELDSSSTKVPADDCTAELGRLRAEAETLRKQTNELAKELAEHHRSPPLPYAARANTGGPGGSAYVVSDSNSEEYKEQLNRIGAASPHFGPFNTDARKDAQNLAEAVRKYAREHQGEFPSNLDQATAYFFKEYRPPQTSEFEILYQGSLNDLTNIPDQVVALVRERQPWRTSRGKWGRIYVMANGFVRIVESDDNFQSWEAEHIIPPPSAGQQ